MQTDATSRMTGCVMWDAVGTCPMLLTDQLLSLRSVTTYLSLLRHLWEVQHLRHAAVGTQILELLAIFREHHREGCCTSLGCSFHHVHFEVVLRLPHTLIALPLLRKSRGSPRQQAPYLSPHSAIPRPTARESTYATKLYVCDGEFGTHSCGRDLEFSRAVSLLPHRPVAFRQTKRRTSSFKPQRPDPNCTGLYVCDAELGTHFGL